MIETLTLITLATLFLVLFRPGKTPPLNNPLVIQRPGRYHMMLAPQLNLAQPFIESIANRLGDPNVLAPNSTTLCFEVRDKEVTAHGQDSYLLAITQRNGMLYFQAAASEIVVLTDKVLADIPRSGTADETLNSHIVAEANAAAQQRGIALTRL